MEMFFLPPWRYSVIALGLLLGTVTGGYNIKTAAAAGQVHERQSARVSDTLDGANVLFLPWVAQENGSSDVDAASYNPKIVPSNFVKGVNNPYFNLKPGTVWIYEGKSPEGAAEKDQTEVLKTTKLILGVTTTVVRDRVWEDGQLVEDTYDWYAQDKAGTVWYFGEYASNYEGGVLVDHAGSWEAGVDGAKPGIQMQADPEEEDDRYRQEYLKGVAEDWAQVIDTDVSIRVPIGHYKDCIKTKEWTPLEPGIVEEKTYCKKVGNLVMGEGVKGESGKTELTQVSNP